MAREPERKGGIFGGRGSMREGLRDVSGDQRVGFADTWLGDFIGADGKAGVQGPGLRRSWFGARRDGPGSEANIPNLVDRVQDNLEATVVPTRNETTGATVPDVSVEPFVPGTGKTLDEILAQPVEGTPQSDVAPEVGDTAPTMGTPSVPSESGSLGAGTEKVPLVTRPAPLPGVVDENAPTIETATSYPIAAKLGQILGPNSSYVTQVLPKVLQAKLTGGSQNDINGLVREVESLPDTQTKQEVLAELYKMRDSMRGGGGGY